ncbi:UDP-glycosyltransferase 73B5 [Striga hermonthica]|uniref:Glycosyltransferase n=1 Tax=Striga hermonthica TaxID=68872 RepID=A0A9N7NJ24_STRHE|nr:UDP-glycosyltransferase 73B5 [Striga hermonthica]
MSYELHFYFLPMMAPGHMIPLVDMARQFARHDLRVKSTILLTHLNAPNFRATVERERRKGLNMDIIEIPFPGPQAGLPDGCESLSSITSPHMSAKFIKALGLLRHPVELVLRQDPPDCLVSDFFFSWADEVAADLRIPRLVFHGAGFFPLCVYHSLIRHRPESDEFVVPGLPDIVWMTKQQLPDYLRGQNPASKQVKDSTEKEAASFGVVVNSFRELESAYVEHYKCTVNKRAWHVGPVSLCNRDDTDKALRGGGKSARDCLDWLDAREPNSVVYVCFGTISFFSEAQIREMAVGLESCGRCFIWVVKDGEGKGWVPEEKGLVIRGWAPQVLILEHEAVGGFLTHCGWNSVMESVCAGKPMITWPISSEQFDNEKLVTEVLRIGAPVGSMEWSQRTDVERGLIKGENIAGAVNRVMVGEEGAEMRRRAKVLSEEARKAVEKGGSSYNDLESLLKELRLHKKR